MKALVHPNGFTLVCFGFLSGILGCATSDRNRSQVMGLVKSRKLELKTTQCWKFLGRSLQCLEIHAKLIRLG